MSMIEMEMLGEMHVEFGISGRIESSEILSTAIGLEPVEISEKTCTWRSSPKEYIRVDECLDDFINTIEGNVPALHSLCAQYGLDSSIKVMVKILGGERPDPELTINASNLRFAQQINASVEIIMLNYPDIE